ncbi:NepR family anti-sigma factor [Methyloligella solikamskensis]|uniref:NepR family anti-sigma factor n=1 Tax=Methyloligella solikamskensis TaxID=1177756 RepID=A0ABW3JCM6_9HYPH
MDLSTGNSSDGTMDDAPSSVAGGKTPKEDQSGLSSDLQAHIGRQLRASFDEVAREPIPDRFLQLLKDLEESGSKK